MGKLWTAVVLLAFILSVSCSKDKNDCPDSCKCGNQITSVIMRCTNLPKDDQSHIQVSHFELAHSEKPLSIDEKVFAGIGLTGVNCITLTNISVLNLDNGAFKALPELTDVKITHTNVTHIHPDIFKFNNKLKKLNLTNNPLQDIESFIKSASVEELDMSFCNLTNIPLNTFEHLSQLTLIDLSGNNIKELIPGTFDVLTDIDEIRLSNNLITKIPNDIFVNNDDLQNLYLDNNPLITFSADIVQNLIILSMRNCKLQFLNSNMFGVPDSLQHVDLSGNKIKKIQLGTFRNIKQLKTINLSGNELQHIDENIFSENRDLEKIVFDDNKKINVLPEFRTNGSFNVYWFSCQNCGLQSLSSKTFRDMPGIVTLKLAHNKITDIRTDVFKYLTDLTDLDISYNQISTLDDNTFKNNINLHSLNLAGNTLKALHPSIFKRNTNLQNLDLSNCGLFELWTSKKSPKLSSIQNLNISSNRIELITIDDVGITDKLKSLDISENPIECAESYKTLIEYLTTNDIQDSKYKTHENMGYTVEQLSKDMVHWKDQAKERCPNLVFAETETEKDIDEVHEIQPGKVIDSEPNDNTDYESDSEEDDKNEDTENEEIIDEEVINDDLQSETKDAINLIDDDDSTVILPSRHEPSYSYFKPIFVFISTAVAILALTIAFVMIVTSLFIKKRRQIIQVPRIISIGHISKLKKNSGLVYQPLSEEKDGIKTPILSRFIAMPHQTASAPDNV